MGLLFCNLLLDPRGSWIATPDYLGAGASTRKVIPWRQIESLSRLSLFSLNFFIPSHSPFIFLSISLRHVDTHFLPLLHKHTALFLRNTAHQQQESCSLFAAVLWPLLCYSPWGELNSTSPQIQFAARTRPRLERREVAAFSNPSVQRDFIVSAGVSDSSSGRRRAVSPQQQ